MRRLSSDATSIYKALQAVLSILFLVLGGVLVGIFHFGWVALIPIFIGSGLFLHFWFFVRPLCDVFVSEGKLRVEAGHDSIEVPSANLVRVGKSLTLRVPCLIVEYRDQNGSLASVRFIPGDEWTWTYWSVGETEKMLKELCASAVNDRDTTCESKAQ